MRLFVPAHPKTRRQNPQMQTAAMLLTLAAGTLGYGCQKSAADNAAGAGAAAMPVQVQIAPAMKIPDTSEYLSILKSRHSAAINPQVEGQITRIFVKSGDHVKAGTPLLQIDPLKQEATVNSQEASRTAQEPNLRYAKVSLERAQKLFDAGVISKQELDNGQTGYDAALAQVTTIDEPGALEAYIYVPAERAKNLKAGLPVRLLDTAGNSVSETRVTFVSPQVETDTQTVLAKATIENPRSKLRIAQQV